MALSAAEKAQRVIDRAKRREEELVAHQRREEVREALEKVFPNTQVRYTEDRDKNSVAIDLRTYTDQPSVTFEKLARVSLMFGGTKKIDLIGGSESTGYCDTCSGSEDFMLVKVQGVDFEKLDLRAATAVIVDD